MLNLYEDHSIILVKNTILIYDYFVFIRLEEISNESDSMYSTYLLLTFDCFKNKLIIVKLLICTILTYYLNNDCTMISNSLKCCYVWTAGSA